MSENSRVRRRFARGRGGGVFLRHHLQVSAFPGVVGANGEIEVVFLPFLHDGGCRAARRGDFGEPETHPTNARTNLSATALNCYSWFLASFDHCVTGMDGTGRG